MCSGGPTAVIFIEMVNNDLVVGPEGGIHKRRGGVSRRERMNEALLLGGFIGLSADASSEQAAQKNCLA